MEKQNKILKVIILILVFVLILGIGMGAGYFINNQNNNSGTEVKNVTTEEKASKEKNDISQSQNTANETENTKTVIQTREMTADEIYSTYSKNMQSKIKSLAKDLPKEYEGNTFFDLKNVHSVEEFPGAGTHINEKLEAFVNIKETGDHIKILDNAIDCGICPIGNGGNYYLIWAVDVNGDLYTRNYDTQDSNNKIANSNLTKKQGLKNIIQVVECSGPSAHYGLAIDILGNTYELY